MSAQLPSLFVAPPAFHFVPANMTLAVCLHGFGLHVALLAEQQAPVCCLLLCPFLAKPPRCASGVKCCLAAGMPEDRADSSMPFRRENRKLSSLSLGCFLLYSQLCNASVDLHA